MQLLGPALAPVFHFKDSISNSPLPTAEGRAAAPRQLGDLLQNECSPERRMSFWPSHGEGRLAGNAAARANPCDPCGHARARPRRWRQFSKRSAGAWMRFGPAVPKPRAMPTRSLERRIRQDVKAVKVDQNRGVAQPANRDLIVGPLPGSDRRRCNAAFGISHHLPQPSGRDVPRRRPTKLRRRLQLQCRPQPAGISCFRRFRCMALNWRSPGLSRKATQERFTRG